MILHRESELKAVTRPDARSTTGKAGTDMSILLIQQAICYMEEHIYEYIRNRRLTLAAQELQTTDLSVIDAAYKYGYESPESFSKAFSRFHGSTPKQAKKPGARLHLFNPLVIKIITEGGSVMDYRMEHRKSQQFLAMVRSFPNEGINDDSDHSIPDFWTECNEKNLSILKRAKKVCSANYGCLSLRDNPF